MTASQPPWRHPEFARGARDMTGISLGIGAWGLVTGIAMILLSLTQSLLVFYLLFCLARMNWAGPFDLGIYGGVSNWFVARRATPPPVHRRRRKVRQEV